MTGIAERNRPPVGLYLSFAGASLVALALVVILAWPRGPQLAPRQLTTSFETDSPP